MLEGVDRDDGRDRAERLLGRDERIGADAVEDRRLPIEPRREAVSTRSACDDGRAAVDSIGDVLVHLRRDAVVVERAERRLVSEWIPEDDALRHEPGELRDELVAHVAVDEQPLARGAALARAEEARGDGRLRGFVEVGVLQHDDRPVPPELEDERLPGRRLRDLLPGLRRADEADPVRAGIAGDLVADD